MQINLPIMMGKDGSSIIVDTAPLNGQSPTAIRYVHMRVRLYLC